MAQTTHSMKLARTGIFIICHGSLLPWTGTWTGHWSVILCRGGLSSVRVMTSLTTSPPSGSTWLQGPFLWLQNWSPIRSQSHLLQGHAPCRAMWMATILEPAGSHDQGHRIIFLLPVLGPYSLFLKIPILILPFP